MGKIVNQAEYAKIRGRSVAWVDGKRKEGMPSIPAARKGLGVKIDTEQAIEWELTKLKERYESQDPEDDSRAEWERRQIKAKAMTTELDLAIMRGELYQSTDVDQAFSAACVLFRTQNDALAGRLAGTLAQIDDPAQIRQILLNECRRVASSAADQLNALYAAKAEAVSATPAPNEGGLEVGGG